MSRFSKQRSRDELQAVVLAAVDDSHIAHGVARCAADIALASNGTVVVFTAVAVLPQMHTMFDMGRIDERRIVEEDGRATVARVLPILDSLGVPYRIESRPGIARWGRTVPARDIARSIRSAARDAGADHIVVGSPRAPWTSGSGVAARLARRSRADVVVVPLQVSTSGIAKLGVANAAPIRAKHASRRHRSLDRSSRRQGSRTEENPRMTAIHQCPRCELRFPDRYELEDHLTVDHRRGKAEHVPHPARTTATVSSPGSTETSTR